MTDAERTSAQAEEQEQAQQNGGLFSKIVETARSVVETVTETAKDVVETVAERGPDVVSGAAAAAGNAASTVAGKVRDLSGDQPAGQAPTTAVAAGEAQTAESRPVAVAEEMAPSAGADEIGVIPVPVVAVAQEARKRASRVYGAIVGEQQPAAADAGIGAVVRQRVSRVYGALTGEAPAAEAKPQPDAQAEPQAGASYQPPAEGAAKGGRPRRFKDIQAGMQLQGKVTSIALYGIFVDVGVGRDGLVHISEMSEQRIDSPTDLVQIGQPVDVWVKSVDPDARRISLTMRDPNRPKPERQERRGPRRREVNRERLAELKPGDTVEGVISSLAPFGAFVDIGVGKDGLVHVSELAEGRVERPEDAVQVGERYTFKILEVDPDGNRISLSLRRALRSQRMQQLEPGVEMDGTISGVAPFGAFVDVGVGRDGLVHISELSPERVNSVEDVVKVGDKVRVKIIEVESNSKRISLTMRVDEPLPNERERPALRPAGAGFGGERPAGGFPVAPTFTTAPAFDEPGGMGDRGGDRGRRGGGRESGRADFGRGESRGAPSSAGRSTGRRSGPGGGGDRPDRGRGGRSRRDAGEIYEGGQEVYTFEDPEEETFTGDATLEDLLSKFNSGKGRDRRGVREQNEGEDDEAGRDSRNEAIRRTLALRDEE